jgi:hypothetical protein
MIVRAKTDLWLPANCICSAKHKNFWKNNLKFYLKGAFMSDVLTFIARYSEKSNETEDQEVHHVRHESKFNPKIDKRENFLKLLCSFDCSRDRIDWCTQTEETIKQKTIQIKFIKNEKMGMEEAHKRMVVLVREAMREIGISSALTEASIFFGNRPLYTQRY